MTRIWVYSWFVSALGFFCASLILFIANPVYADCTVTTNTGYGGTWDSFGYTNELYGANKFTACEAGDVTEITAAIYKSGAPANVTVEIWDDNAGVPGTIVGTGSAGQALSNTSCGLNAFTVASTLINGDDYWVVFSDGTTSGGNYYVLCGTAGNGGAYRKSTNGTSWTGSDPSSYMTFDIVSAGGGGGASSTPPVYPEGPIINPETLKSTYFVVFSMMGLYFVVKLFSVGRA